MNRMKKRDEGEGISDEKRQQVFFIPHPFSSSCLFILSIL
jgi:hypothetical protein